MKCSRCNTAAYCGRACQKQHWKIHKEICNHAKEQMNQMNQMMPDFESDWKKFGKTGVLDLFSQYHMLLIPTPDKCRRECVWVDYKYDPSQAKKFTISGPGRVVDDIFLGSNYPQLLKLVDHGRRDKNTSTVVTKFVIACCESSSGVTVRILEI
eukprot:Pgem_evm2s8327